VSAVYLIVACNYMDKLSLRKYFKQGSLVDNSINSLKPITKADQTHKGNTSLTNKGLIRSDKEFLEFFIDDRPLSSLLDTFYKSNGSILDNWIGVLGSSANRKDDIIKVKQLLGKSITDKEIRQLYPDNWTDDEFEWYLEKTREELSNPEILIYCCAECGDYDCGGIAITIGKTNNSVIWTISDNDSKLKFEFDKYLYFEVFNRYMQYCDPTK